MDMLVCLDYFSDYFSKNGTGLVEVVNAVVKQITPENLKEQMKAIANTFLTHRQIGKAEQVTSKYAS